MWAASSLGLFAAGDKLYLVKITDVDNTDEYEIKTPEELKALQDEIKAQAKVFPKAVEAARKEWKNDPRTSKTAFPASAVGPRQVMVVGTPFISSDQASKKLDSMQTRESKRDAARIRKAAEWEDKQKKNKRSQEDIDRDKARMKEREVFEKQAIELVRRMVDEALVSTPPAAQAGQPGETNPPANTNR